MLTATNTHTDAATHTRTHTSCVLIMQNGGNGMNFLRVVGQKIINTSDLILNNVNISIIIIHLTDIQDPEHVCTTVPQPTHQPPRQRTDTTLDGYATAHPTVRSHRLRETFFSMRRVVCMELTSCVCHLFSNLG